jgi:hypothetical protein
MQAIEEFLTTWAAAEQAGDAAIHMSFIAGTAGAPPIPGAGGRPGGERSAT